MLKIPSTISFDNLRSFLGFRSRTENLVSCPLEIDCSGIKFVDPTGLCLLKHWFHDLDQRGVRLGLVDLPVNMEAYMRRLDLFDGVTAKPIEDRTSANARNDRDGSLIEVSTLRATNEIPSAAAKIASTITHGLDIDQTVDQDRMRASPLERVEGILEFVFSEILLNSLDHGRGRGYGHAHVNLAAQYFPKLDTLEVAVVDNGCGLLETLQGHERMDGDISDRKAILIARQPRVSCNRDAALGRDTRNQGIGLTISTEIALAARGGCGIFSGSHRINFLRSGIFDAEIPYWRGTGALFRFERLGLTEVDKGAIIAALPGFRPINEIVFS